MCFWFGGEEEMCEGRGVHSGGYYDMIQGWMDGWVGGFNMIRYHFSSLYLPSSVMFLPILSSTSFFFFFCYVLPLLLQSLDWRHVD